jgi:hypothetical protein
MGAIYLISKFFFFSTGAANFFGGCVRAEEEK